MPVPQQKRPKSVLSRRKNVCRRLWEQEAASSSLATRTIKGLSPLGDRPFILQEMRYTRGLLMASLAGCRVSGEAMGPSAARPAVACAAGREFKSRHSDQRRRGLRIVRDGVFFFKAIAVSHSLRRSSFPNRTHFVGLRFGF